jgi:hypothetical protein
LSIIYCYRENRYTCKNSYILYYRINKAPVKGFEKDVGSRTTHHLIYPESATEYHPGAALLLLPFKPDDIKWLLSIFTDKKPIGGFWAKVPTSLPGAKPKDTYIIHPDFFYHVHTKWLGKHTGKYPSTGAVALILGLRLCDELHVMGFGVNKAKNQWDHYYEVKNSRTAISVNAVRHLPDLEANLRQHMMKDSLISLYPGKRYL